MFLSLLTIILLTNGLLQLFVIKKEETASSTFALILLLLSLVFLLVFLGVLAYKKKVNALPPQQLQTIAIIDLANNTLLNEQHQLLTSLSNTHLVRSMQLASSSPELFIRWNGGSLSIVKGNPFSGGIAAIEKVLLGKSIRKI